MQNTSSNVPSSSSAPLPHQLVPLLTLENFSKTDFDLADLVGRLTEEGIARSGRKDGLGIRGSGGGLNGFGAGGSGSGDAGIGNDRTSNGFGNNAEAAFSPNPFITFLESSLSHLLPLQKSSTQQIEKLEKEVRERERGWRSCVKKSGDGWETVTTAFTSLDSRITEVGKTAIRMGEQLESLSRQRERASEAHDLILYYNDFSRGDTSRLEAIRKEGGKDGRQKVAVAARRLLAISKEVEGLEGGEETRERIEKFCEKFEKDMLKLFDKAYRKGDPKMMAHCAKTLLDFNGGQSCIQIYVNQHDFFYTEDRLNEAGKITETPIWESLPFPDSLPPKSEPGLTELYNKIRETITQEAQILNAVFPNPGIVMQVFLQRVFDQVIQSYLEQLLTSASSSSTLASLRILHLARSQTTQLMDDIKSHEFFRTASISSSALFPFSSTSTSLIGIGGPTSATTAGGTGVFSPTRADTVAPPGTVGGGGGVVGAGGGAIGGLNALLDQAVEELFVPYMDAEGNRYLDKESKSLNELYASFLLKFTEWHRLQNKTKPSNTLFDRMVNQMAAAAHAAQQSATQAASTYSQQQQADYAAGGTTSSSGATLSPTPTPPVTTGTQETSRFRGLLKISGITSSLTSAGSGAAKKDETASTSATSAPPSAVGSGDPSQPDQPAVLVNEGDGDLTLEMAEKMLKWHAEAVGRMVELSATAEAPKSAYFLMRLLADTFGKAYVETALDTALAQISAYDAKAEPDLRPISVIRLADMVVHLWQRYITTALMPLAGASVTVRREMAIYNNHVVVRIEGKINAIVQKTTDAVISWLTVLLNRQKKADFRPKNDTFELFNSEPCFACSDLLGRLYDSAKSGLTGKNLEIFLTEIGVTFHSLLLEHFKKFPVNATGGLVLTNDLVFYLNTISSWSIPALTDRFEMLRQLANVFVVRPETLKSVMSESYLSRIDDSLLRPYLMMRTDWGDYSKKYWEEVLSGGNSNTSEGGIGDGNSGGDGRDAGRKYGLERMRGLMKELENLSRSDRHSKDMGSEGEREGRWNSSHGGFMAFG